MDQDKRMAWGQFRFSVIAPLVCRHVESEAQRRELRRQILEQVYVTPNGEKKRVAKRTLNSWLSRYRQYGFEGLLDPSRKTLGSCRAIPEQILDRAEELRRELRTRSIKAIVSIMRTEGFDMKGVCRSTLNLQLKRRGAGKDKLASEKGVFQRWEQKHANALWQADTSSGVWLPDPTNPKKVKRTRLISFIDDATRVCTHAQFYWDEKLPSLIDCFRKALLKRGKPGRVLCDNAFIYHSTTMELMCAQLGIELSFCQEYSPEGKGKVEKHYGTIKAGFYQEAKGAGLTTIDELNKFFWAWLTREYHHEKHSSLDMTPLERWRQDEHAIKRVPTESLRRALMFKAKRRVNRRTALIRLENRYFQARAELAGETVEIRWLGAEPQELEIWLDGKLIEIARQSIVSTNIDFSKKPEKRRKERPGQTLSSSKNYRMALVRDHDGEASAPAPVLSDDYMSEPEFASSVATALKRELEPEENEYLSQFFYQNSPLKAKLIQALLTQAVNAKGTKMHLRYYLEHIRTSLFKTRR